MTNKFRNLKPLDPGQDSMRETQVGMAGGLRGDQAPWAIPPDASPNMSEIRFERGAIRKDFGWSGVGSAAAIRVLGLIEHKFIDSNLVFHRIVRITRVGGNAVLEVWDGTSWTVVDTSTETINDRYLSLVSAQGGLYAAEGTQILEWTEAPALTTQEDDFPSANSLTAIDDTTSVAATPGDSAEARDYEMNFDVEITTCPDEDVMITLEFYHEATLIGSRDYYAYTTDSFPVQFPDELFDFNRVVATNDDITIKFAAISGGNNYVSNTGDSDGPTDPLVDRVLDKSPHTNPAYDDRFTFRFDVDAIVFVTVNVGLYYYDGSWNKINEFQYTSAGTKEETVTITDFVHASSQFRVLVESSTSTDETLSNLECDWGYLTATFDIHGHNKGTDADDPAGLVYVTEGAPVSSWAVVAAAAPAATYIFPFARRLIALRDGGDVQSLAWPVDGDLTNWSGTGSGQIFLVESGVDPINPLQAGAVLGSNFAALFRSRSIWRVFETGSVTQAIGAVQWIENLGTESPFSVRNVKGGVMFLGHDLQVYYLTQNGPQPVGTPIQQELIEILTAGLDLVDAGYDQIFDEYYLGVPEDGGSRITKVYIFDVDKFLKEGELNWRTRPMTVERFATASLVE